MNLFNRRPERLDDTQEIPPTEPMSAGPVPDWVGQSRQLLGLARRVLLTESLRPRELRDQSLIDFALDVRSVVLPPAPLEEPSVRPSVPVVPGRTT